MTLLEAYHTPLARVLGDEMGRMCADLHVANGMDLRCSITIDHLESDPGGVDPVTVVLDDGTRLPADVVVVGIGVVAVGRLAGGCRRLNLDNGVRLRRDPVRDRRPSPWSPPGTWPTGRGPPRVDRRRVEHWTNAAEGGAAAARNLLAGSAAATPYDPVPFFWSDQYATKIQMIGLTRRRRRGGGGERFRRGGQDDRPLPVRRRLGGVLAFSQPAKLMGYRPLLAAGASFDEALAHARS